MTTSTSDSPLVKIIFALFLASLSMRSVLAADAIALSLLPGSALPGGAVALNLDMTATGTQAAGLQWTFRYAPGDVVSVQVVAGPASVAAGKTVNCAAGSGTYTCLLAGVNSSTIANGTVATATFSISTTPSGQVIPIQVSDSLSSSLTGVGIATTATGSSVSILSPVAPAGLVCSPSSFTGAGTSTCTVTLSGLAPGGGATVTLSSNNTSVTVPASATVAAAATSTTFTATVAAVTVDASAQLTATLNGGSASTSLSLVAPVTPASLSCNPATLPAGATSTCTVTLNKPALGGGQVVTLSSDNAPLSVPASATVAAGATSATFTATAGTPTKAQTVTVTATANGVSRTTVVTLQAGVRVSALSCSPSSFTGAGTSTCTVTLSGPAPGGGATVTLSSNNTSVTVPASTTVAAAAASTTFTATVAAVTVDASAQLTATLNGGSASTSLSLVAPVTPASLSCSPATLSAGTTSTCTVTLNKPALGGGQVVTLSSNNAALTVPASATVAAGATSATFTATAGTPATAQTVTVTATAGGTAVRATVTISTSSPRLTGLSCSPTTLVVSGSVACSVSISAPAPAGGASVSLSVTSAALSVPAAVQVSAGATSATFTATAASISAAETATITALAGGGVATFAISLRPVEPTGLSCAPNPVNAGAIVACNVSLNSAAFTTPAVVQLSSSRGTIQVPSSITFQPGQISRLFYAYTARVASTQTVRLTATANSTSASVDIMLLGPQGTRTHGLAVTLPGAGTVILGDGLRFRVDATDSRDAPPAATVSGLPAGAKFAGQSGEFEWKPQADTSGRHEREFVATGSDNGAVSGRAIVDVVSTPRLEALVNAASMSRDAVCSPGSIAAVHGSGFASANEASYQVSVQVNGQKAPVLTVSASRIWFQCPDLSPGTELDIVVETPAGLSVILRTTMRETTPGLFTLDDSGRGQGSILLAGTEGFVVVRNPHVPGSPARPGDVVTILATGLGRWLGNAGIVKPFARVTGVPAEVVAVRLNELPGLYEVDVRIPLAAQIGDAVPVILEIPALDGRLNFSNTVTIAIEEKP